MRRAFWVGLVALLSVGCSAPAAAPQAPVEAGASATVKSAQPARAEPDLPGTEAGDFDFYVLALSWSPTYCLDEGERADPLQCAPKRPYDFIVHGLWPQFEHGRVEECAGRAPALKDDLVNSLLPIMPSRGLIRHEWRAHGQCSGLSAADYFAALRKARSMVHIPPAFDQPTRDKMTNPDAVERAFIAKNKGLEAAGIAVTCSGRRLREVRICLTKSFEFRTCSSVDRRACTRPEIVAPASRGG